MTLDILCTLSQDIWKGHLHDTEVCLKVLRILPTEENGRERVLREFCREALLWRQLHHPNILTFLGVNKYLFAPSYCLVSPWMKNGNIMSFLEVHPGHDRLTMLVQVAEGMQYLHNHDPPIVHADIRGANILVMDDLRCCLTAFDFSLFAPESDTPAFNSSYRMHAGTLRWLAPEHMNLTFFDQSNMTPRDIYAYGCTVVEVFTGKPPFSHIRNEAALVREVVTKRRLPPRPPTITDDLWSLVTACLTTVPSHRPHVGQILKSLQTRNSSGPVRLYQQDDIFPSALSNSRNIVAIESEISSDPMSSWALPSLPQVAALSGTSQARESEETASSPSFPFPPDQAIVDALLDASREPGPCHILDAPTDELVKKFATPN
ncbi:kinase-like domain-containing protein, partial [Armillaria novae-zelandiae]